MSINITEIRGWILGVIIGIVLVVAGFVVVNVLYSVGQYIVGQVSAQINESTTLVTPQQIQIIGLALMMSGITLVIVSISMMLRVIIGSLTKTE
ncbi:MAG: hypothetical protein QXZ31_03725 [Thermofilaceae archaeon]